MVTSAGARAGAATNSRVGLLIMIFVSLTNYSISRILSPDELPCQPEERLLEIIVGFG